MDRDGDVTERRKMADWLGMMFVFVVEEMIVVKPLR